MEKGKGTECGIECIGKRKAIAVSSILFSILHIPSILSIGMEKSNMVIMLLTIFTAGILLSLLYLKGGLKMAAGFHFSWNYFQYHIFSLRSGFGIFGITVMKPEYTGGQAGPEAGFLGLLALIVGILLLLGYSVKNKYLSGFDGCIHHD